jgi:tetratricopeptide (TPR) repeat protein
MSENALGNGSNGANGANGDTAEQGVAGLSLQGGAAIVAPVSAFPNGIPANALIVVPLAKPTEEFTGLLEKGPVGCTLDQMWKLLGFNGPAVQVQDDQGRPIAIGLEDLLEGLDKSWRENMDDLNRGRIYAQELLKYTRMDKAEEVLLKLVAKGGTGEDWLALGVAQLQLEKFDNAEGTLKGAQNLLKGNPYPALHLAKLYQAKKDDVQERSFVEASIQTDENCVDAWAYLFQYLRTRGTDETAIAEIEQLAATRKAAAPYIAIQGFYAASEETFDKAVQYAKKAVEKNGDDPLALVCLSALYGQKGDLDNVIKLLQPHEAKMTRDVRLAHNYFEALFQSRQLDKVTRLLNALAGSQNQQVKRFALERSRAVAQIIQRQQAAARATTGANAPGGQA